LTDEEFRTQSERFHSFDDIIDDIIIVEDWRRKTMLPEPNCSKRNCKWFLGVLQVNEDEWGEVSYCSAFPGGIPDEIAYGKNLHLKPIAGQVGDIIFEKE
jgi:hypothetical protein